MADKGITFPSGRYSSSTFTEDAEGNLLHAKTYDTEAMEATSKKMFEDNREHGSNKCTLQAAIPMDAIHMVLTDHPELDFMSAIELIRTSDRYAGYTGGTVVDN